jgi:hypothetical protein
VEMLYVSVGAVAHVNLLYRYKIVRGALDLGGVAGRANSRSKYGSECSARSAASCTSLTTLALTAKKPKK